MRVERPEKFQPVVTRNNIIRSIIPADAQNVLRQTCRHLDAALVVMLGFKIGSDPDIHFPVAGILDLVFSEVDRLAGSEIHIQANQTSQIMTWIRFSQSEQFLKDSFNSMEFGQGVNTMSDGKEPN